MSYDETDYALMRGAWLSGEHVGANKPTLRAYVRTTRIKRDYRQVPADEVYASIPGLPKGIGPKQVWKGIWDPKTEWHRLPNVLSFRGDQDFDSNGVQTGTLEIDNVGQIQHTGVVGIWHTLERGYYAPFRGFDPKARPAVGTKNDWYDTLNDKSTEIMVVAGYGAVVFPVFNGLINDVDLSSRPDRITITARDAGQVFTDQHVFVNAKVRHVRDPITFCDRLAADKIEKVAVGAEASDSMGTRPPRFVTDDIRSTKWKSAPRDHSNPGDLPWVQVFLPNGRYESFAVRPDVGGLSCYVAILARDANAPGGQGARRHVDGEKFQDNSWVDAGNGNVPGTNVPFVKHIDKVRSGESVYVLEDYGYDLGDGSAIRLYFTDLDRGLIDQTHDYGYFASVSELAGVKRELIEDAKKEDWILVDDLSDVVKTVFQWGGINEWEVESTGVRLKGKAVFNRGNYLIDIINAAAEQVGYVFYMRPPESFDESEDNLSDRSTYESMGIGVFRQPQSMRRQAEAREPVELVHENKLLQGINARLTDEPLAYNIRVRGRAVKDRKGGRTLGGDDTARWMYVYRPPWSRDNQNYRNGNIKKYVVHHDNRLRSLDECKVAALLIAFREALEAATATTEFAAFPPLQLDQQMSVFDTGTGLSTRIWIAAKQIEFQGGPQGHFKMSVGGALLDLPDISKVREELRQAINDDIDPGLSNYEQTHYGSIYRNN